MGCGLNLERLFIEAREEFRLFISMLLSNSIAHRVKLTHHLPENIDIALKIDMW